MKKILAMILTVAMIVSTFTVTVIAEEPEIIEIYAGLATLTVKYSKNITEADIDNITIIDDNRQQVSFTKSIKENLLVLKPLKQFELEKNYKIFIGENLKKIFKINKIWEPGYADANSDGKVDSIGTTIRFRSSAEAYVGITENKEIILTQPSSSTNNRLYMYPNIETTTDAYKNMSMTFDVKFLANSDNRASFVVGYNINSVSAYIDTSSYKDNVLAWNTNADVRKPWRAYKFKTSGDVNYTKGFVTNGDNGIANNKAVLTPDNQIEIKSDSVKGTVSVDTTSKKPLYGYAYQCDMVLGADIAELPSYTMTIDKIGADGNLRINDTLVDTVIAQKYYDENNVTGETPIETGYFTVGFFGKTNGMVIDNLMITQSEIKDLTDIELKIVSDEQLYGDLNSFYIDFSDSIALVSEENVKEYIKVTKDGEPVLYDYQINGGRITIDPVEEIELDKTFDVKVLAGFGYDEYLVKNDVNLTYTYVLPVNDLIVVSSPKLNGNEESFDIVFDNNITTVSEENVKEYIKISQDGENVLYDYAINNNKIIIKPIEGIVAEQKYDVVVLKGFGFEGYKVKNDVNLSYTYYDLKSELIEEITAGAQSVTVKLAIDIEAKGITEDSLGISLTDDEDILVPYTISINGNILTIIPNQTLKADTESYILSVLGVKKKIDVKTLWKPKFVDDNGNIDVSDLYSGNNSKDFKLSIEVIDENTVLLSGGNNILFDDPHSAECTDTSLIADVYYIGLNICTFVGYNAGSTGKGSIYAYNGPFTAWAPGTTSTRTTPHARYVSCYNGSSLISKDYYEEQLNKSVNPATNNGAIPGLTTFEEGQHLAVKDMRTELKDLKKDYPISHRYVIDKNGSIGKLIVNGALVDILDTQEYYDVYNNKNSTSYKAPTTGYFFIAPNQSYNMNQKVVVSNAAIVTTTVDDIREGGLSIVKNTYSVGANGKIEGTLKLRNYSEEDKYASVVAIAYDDNAEFVGAVKVIDQKIPGEQIVCEDFVINTDLTEANVEFVLIDENTKIPQIEINSIIKSDYENDVIKVTGKVKKSYNKQYAYMLLSKDGTFTSEWTETSKSNGDFRRIEIPANAEEFEYEFKYTAGENDVYPMSLYQINCDNKVITKKLDTYNYAGEKAIDSYIESLKSTKTTFTELLKYAQSMGIDVKYADTPSKQDMLVETLYTERENITSKENVLALISTAKARALLISDIKVKGITVALVNELISKYKTDAKLDTSKYDALSSEQKYAICKKFVKANYEDLGYEAFIEAFNSAVANPPVIGGGAAGGGGGGGGGAVVKPNVIPVLGTSSAGEQVVEKTDAVDAPVVTGNFTDLKDYIWAQDAIDYLAEKGVIAGIGNNQFNPEGTVTREQLAKMIVLAFEKYNGDAKNDFADVSSDNWSATYIASAKANGLIKGVSENEFAPLSAVTREDIAVILYRATLLAGKTYETKKENFTDFDDVSDYAKEAVAYMAGTGIINGFEDGSFNPKSPATRAQTAKLIYEALGKGE